MTMGIVSKNVSTHQARFSVAVEVDSNYTKTDELVYRTAIPQLLLAWSMAIQRWHNRLLLPNRLQLRPLLTKQCLQGVRRLAITSARWNWKWNDSKRKSPQWAQQSNFIVSLPAHLALKVKSHFKSNIWIWTKSGNYNQNKKKTTKNINSILITLNRTTRTWRPTWTQRVKKKLQQLLNQIVIWIAT